MSWSISCGGSKQTVKQSVQGQAGQIDNYGMNDPEDALRNQARSLILSAVAAQPDDASISVTAYGSASTDVNGRTTQSLSISISAS